MKKCTIKNVFIMIFIVLLSLSGLTGCNSYKGVNFATKSEIISWCETKYGSVEFLNSSKSKENSIEFNMKDKDKNFEYTVESLISNTENNSEEFSESKISNFDIKYKENFSNICKEDLEKIKTDFDIEIIFEASDSYIAIINGSDEEKISKAAEALSNLCYTFDTRKYWANSVIRIMINDEDNGYYSAEKGRITPEMEYADWFLSKAASEMGVSSDQLELIEIKKQSIKEFPEYKNSSKDQMIDVYYFQYNGQQYYIANLTEHDTKEDYVGNYPKANN